MPCGDNRILTAFFDYLADRALALAEADGAGRGDIGSDIGMARALTESRTVLDVLSEVAALLDIDSSPLRAMASGAAPVARVPVMGGV